MAVKEHPFIDTKSQLVGADTDTQDITINKRKNVTKNNTKEKVEKYKFPSNLNPKRYMRISMYQLELKSIDSIAKSLDADKSSFVDGILNDKNSKVQGVFLLPLPNNIQETVEQSWDDFSFSKKIVEMAGKGGEKVVSTANTFFNRLPNYSTFKRYQGPGNRSFSFEYLLSPKNRSDADELKRIVRDFKAFTSPTFDKETKGGLFKNPRIASLKFTGDINNKENTSFLDEVLKAKLFVVSSINLNYSPAGNMDLFHDGTPKVINLSISFTEFTPLTSVDWNAEIGKAT